jgi:hypothetical protein
MRELWATGFMHNRVRMIVASFLIKHLLIDWRAGEAWFWDTLVDADLANNVGNWQWVAGSGADAAPYFRIFNPIAQGQKFDPHGAYVRRWVPELANLPDALIHEPWKASPQLSAARCVSMGNRSWGMRRRANARSRPIAASRETSAPARPDSPPHLQFGSESSYFRPQVRDGTVDDRYPACDLAGHGPRPRTATGPGRLPHRPSRGRGELGGGKPDLRPALRKAAAHRRQDAGARTR